MLPNADHAPPGLEECRIDGSIAIYIQAELACPVPRIPLWRCAVLRAGVPVATIDEASDPRPREDDVRPDESLSRSLRQVRRLDPREGGVVWGAAR